jgi:hypothetical protein
VSWWNPNSWEWLREPSKTEDAQSKAKGAFVYFKMDRPFYSITDTDMSDRPCVFVDDADPVLLSRGLHNLQFNWGTMPSQFRAKIEVGDKFAEVTMEELDRLIK